MMRRTILDCMTLVGTTPSRFDGEKAYVSTGAVDCDHIDYTQTESVTYGNRPSRANLSVTEGDILFAKMCGTKKTLRISKTMADHLYSTGFCAVRANEAVMIPELLYHLLASEQFLSQKDQNSSGATQKAITNAGLKKITVNVPSLDEQRKLAAKLDCIEDMAAKRHEQLVYLEQLVKSRFIELFGDPKQNPNRYKVVPFKELIEYMGDIGSNGANSVVVEHLDMHDEEDYALMVRFLNFTSNDFSKNVKYISKEAYEFFRKSKIYGGELIFCKIGSAGLSYIMPHLGRPVSLGLNQIMVRTSSAVNMTYLYNYIHTSYGEYLIDGCINGAVTKSITKGALKEIPIVLPPMDQQAQFAAFVEQTDKSKLAVKQGLQELEILKKSLMQQYFG